MAHKEWKHAPDGGEERMCQRILGMGGLPSRPPPAAVGLTVYGRYLVPHFLHGSGSLFIWRRTGADAHISSGARTRTHGVF